MNSEFPIFDSDDQKFKVADMLNAGIIVTAPPESPMTTGLLEPEPFHVRCLRSMLWRRPKNIVVPETTSRRVFLPYDQEGTVIFVPVGFTHDGKLRFCPGKDLLAGENFKGTSERTSYDSLGVEVFSRVPIRGFNQNDRRKAVLRCKGDRIRLRAVIEDLVNV